MRPNPIGVTEADVVEVQDRGLVVAGLDARDGSPLIDIKAVCR
jgi:tRNA (Thr-GGU) A37 N-methylase